MVVNILIYNINPWCIYRVEILVYLKKFGFMQNHSFI